MARVVYTGRTAGSRIISLVQRALLPNVLKKPLWSANVRTGSSCRHQHSEYCGTNKDSHSGYIDLQWLKENAYSSTRELETVNTKKPAVTTAIPKMNYSELVHDDTGLRKWMKHLNECGACLVTNVHTNGAEIKKLANMAGRLQTTAFGEKTMDMLASEELTDFAYPLPQTPSHMNLIFQENTPGLQLLHCLRMDECVEGGENVLLDAFAVVDGLRKNHPQHFNTLTRVPATFEQFHFNREEPTVLRCRRTHIVLDENGEVAAVNWSTLNMGPLLVTESDVVPYYKAYHCLAKMIQESTSKLTHRLETGQMLTFNNRRMLHSQQDLKLNGGVQHLKGASVVLENFDSMKSMFLHPKSLQGIQQSPCSSTYLPQHTYRPASQL